MTASSEWFGQSFSELHPLLQQLHLNGGVLIGDVKLAFGQGFAGLIGKIIAKKLNLPTQAGSYPFQVSIAHINNELHWSRCFNHKNKMTSIFIPTSQRLNGYWVEQTGGITFYLTVDIITQGWYWKPIAVKFYGIPLPLWLLPSMNAYKTIESDKYQFHVSVSLRYIGKVLSYQGLLSPTINNKS